MVPLPHALTLLFLRAEYLNRVLIPIERAIELVRRWVLALSADKNQFSQVTSYRPVKELFF